MKIKLSAFFLTAALMIPSVYAANRRQRAAQQENKSWIPKIIKDNKAVQAAIVVAALGGAAYTFTEPMLSFGSTYAKRILLSSQTARWISLATWNLIYDNCPTCADWLYFQALI